MIGTLLIALLAVALPLAVLAALCYAPYFVAHVRYVRAKREFERQLELLPEVFEASRFVITSPLGLGTEPDGGAGMSAIARNGEIATASVLALMRGLVSGNRSD